MVNLSRQKSMVIQLRIKYGSSAVPCATSDHQTEMELYLMECIRYHQRLIECVMHNAVCPEKISIATTVQILTAYTSISASPRS
jgi:hypothetical protein